MNDRITQFGGIDVASAPHLMKKEDNRRTNSGASLRLASNVRTVTGGIRTRPGLDVKVHFPDNTNVWPDILGNWRPYSGRSWNFSSGKITTGGDDAEPWTDFEVPEDIDDGFDMENTDDSDSWLYLWIVCCINQRRFLFGLAASALPTNKPDSEITWEDINAARAAIAAIADRFVSGTVDQFTGVFAYDAMWKLLNDANVGGIPDDGGVDDRNWACFTVNYVEYYAASLAASDVCSGGVRNVYLNEMKKVLLKMLWTQHAIGTDSLLGGVRYCHHDNGDPAGRPVVWQWLLDHDYRFFDYGHWPQFAKHAFRVSGQPPAILWFGCNFGWIGTDSSKVTWTCANIPVMYPHVLEFYHKTREMEPYWYSQYGYTSTVWTNFTGVNLIKDKWTKTTELPVSNAATEMETWKLDLSFPTETAEGVVQATDYSVWYTSLAKWSFPADRAPVINTKGESRLYKKKYRRVL